MRLFIVFICIFFFGKGDSAEVFSSPSKMFSLSSEEMLFASKLSDENRRKFCYTFSLKERVAAMQATETLKSPDQKVEDVFASLYAELESRSQAR